MMPGGLCHRRAAYAAEITTAPGHRRHFRLMPFLAKGVPALAAMSD